MLTTRILSHLNEMYQICQTEEIELNKYNNISGATTTLREDNIISLKFVKNISLALIGDSEIGRAGIYNTSY